MARFPYRIRITDSLNNVSYITRTKTKPSVINYYSDTEVPFALANLFGNKAAEMRFTLTDATDGLVAVKEVRAALRPSYKVVLL